MSQVSPYIMVTRNTCDNSFAESFEITNLERYIRQKRKEGMTSFGLTHVLLACYCRAMAHYPGLNRFIAGQKVYTHGNDIQFCMTIKKEMKLNAQETVVKLFLTPYDTAETIYQKLKVLIEENKKEGDQNDMDAAARVLVSLPSVFLKFVVWLLKVMDYFKLLPRFLTKLSPFHGSLFMTNLGSLGIPPVRHHLYEFGNLPVFLAMGKKYTKFELDRDGEPQKKRYIDFVLTLDERICDGHYYATSMRMMSRILQHPEQLLEPPAEVILDDGIDMKGRT
jgi:hypothetical protein